MATIVGVQFQMNGKIHNYDTNGFELRPDDFVVCETSHGPDLGQVVIGSRPVEIQDEALQLKKILRIATERDLQVSTENRTKEKEAFTICQRKIAEHQLDMKLVSVEYAFDNSKAMFYFTANGRVDFRSLVKDLASVFKMRIELRQIGVRDEARMIGGLGPCGRQICCGAFLDEFQPVSIKMAKEQNLSLNPTKISGVCGRLMCCLKYEQDHYEKTRKIMPRIGREVITPDGTGAVTDLNILKETVFVRITNGDTSEIKEYPLEKIERPGQTATPSDRKEFTAEKPADAAADGENRENSGEDRNDEAEKPAQKDNRGNHETRDNRENRGNRNSQNSRNREQKRSDQLGRPVRRENPNRTQTPAMKQSESGIKSGDAAAEKQPENQSRPAGIPATKQQAAAKPQNAPLEKQSGNESQPVNTPEAKKTENETKQVNAQVTKNPAESDPAEARTAEPAPEKKPESPAPEKKKTSSSWAEAVQKAMDSIS